MGSPTCPTCKGPLREVRNTSAYLNDDQASSQRAGDFYCEKCPPNGRSNANRWCYWWAREVTTPSAPADDATRGCSVAYCETHRDVEIVPGPFCPVCLGSGCRVDGMRDGLRARRADDASGAEAMREACAKVLDAEVLRLKAQVSAGETERMTEALWTRALAVEKLAAAIRALPLPARDDAVEEARGVVVEKAKAWVARPVAGRGAYKATAALEESIDALLAAERDAALRRENRGDQPKAGHDEGDSPRRGA